MKEDRANRELTEMVNKTYCYEDVLPVETFESFKITINKDLVAITTSAKTRYHPLSRLQTELIKYVPYSEEPGEIPVNNEWRNKPEEIEQNITIMAESNNTEIVKTEPIAAPGMLAELRTILLGNIKKIEDGSLSIDKAKEIVAHSHAIINITKVEVDLLKLKNGAGKK